MTQDEIIEMARQTSSQERLPWNGLYIFNSKKELIEFFKLAAAKEREECAMVLETHTPTTTPTWVSYAAAIRARGEQA